jgi:Ca2+:H+ antiporter
MSLKPSIDWLFVFIPLTVVLEHLGEVSAPVVFFAAAIAIVPIAAAIVRATEQIAMRTGDTVGGLLNATFGNAPELIIASVALRAGYVDMVRASLVGAILANLLLALGASFLLGGVKYRDQQFNPVSWRAYSTMMFLAVFSLAVPSAFNREFAKDGTTPAEQMLNTGIAITLLVLYGLYLIIPQFH